MATVFASAKFLFMVNKSENVENTFKSRINFQIKWIPSVRRGENEILSYLTNMQEIS